MRFNLFLSVMACAGALCLGSSCSKTPVPSSGDPIAFQVEEVASKGLVATSANLSSLYGSFVTDAYVCDPEQGKDAHLMNLAKVNYVQGTNAWKTAETFYWPKTSSVAFLSYAPVLDENSLGKMTNLSYNATSKSFSFDYVAMPPFTGDISLSYEGVDVTTQLRSQDLLLAYSEQSVDDGKVKVHFDHALAAIGFDVSVLFQEGEDNSKVSSVVFGLYDVWSKGKCTVDQDGFSWALDKSSDTNRGTAIMLATRSVPEGYGTKIYQNQCTFIIPQAIENEGSGYNIMGFYAYFSDGRFPVMFTVNIPAGTKYEAGKFYGYRLKKSGLDYYLELAVGGIELGERENEDFYEAPFDFQF
ncbi:MAG: fimbrillin family protein [Bacteroidales bacterium]|nr:fimbrillin family protein [Bacteroidales bacterium]